METKTIIYLVAAALILRVVIKVIIRYTKEQKNSEVDKTNHNKTIS
jgi:hypothetical protein